MRYLRSFSLLAFAALLFSSRPLSALVPSELAPPDTIFYCEVPSIPVFYERFLKDHNASVMDPMVAKAMASKVESLIAKRAPIPFTVPLALDANAALYSAVETNLFIASVADGEGALTFLSGGVSPAPEQSVAKLRGMIEAKVPGLAWHNETIEKATVALAEIPGVGPVFLTSSGGWLLFGTSRPALERALRCIAQPIPGLSSTETWKINTVKRSANDQLFYFTRLEAYADLAAKQKRTDIAELFKTRLAGLRAFSWSWATGGAGALGEDTFTYTFTPETAAAFRKIVSPLGPGWRQLAGPNTTVLGVFKLDAFALAASQVLQGIAITPLLEAASTFLDKEAAPLHGAWIADFDPSSGEPMFAVAVRADEASVRGKLLAMPKVATQRDRGFVINGNGFVSFREGVWFLTETAAESDYFQNRKPGPSPVILEQMDRMASAKDAFLDLRLDRLAIVRNYAARLKKNYATWAPILAKRGVAVPATLPDFDFDSYFGPLRSTFGLEGDNLVTNNVFQLGKATGSTLITAQTELVEAAYRPQIAQIFAKCDQLLSVEGDKTSPSLFSICLKTNFIVTALFQPNQNSLFTDIFSTCFLGAAPDLDQP